jgi:hypothetical protein
MLHSPPGSASSERWCAVFKTRNNNIRDRAMVAQQLWDWGWLNPAFAPTRARASDIDGVIEQCGHILILEGKPADYAWAQDSAQFRTLKTLSAKPGMCVLVLYGIAATSTVIKAEQIIPMGPRHLPRVDADNDDVIRWVTQWFAHTHACREPFSCLYADPIEPAASLSTSDGTG